MFEFSGIPASLGERISAERSIPIISIGAGPKCDGQLLIVIIYVINKIAATVPEKAPKTPAIMRHINDLFSRSMMCLD